MTSGNELFRRRALLGVQEFIVRQIGQHHPGRWADVAAVKSLIPLTRSVHRRRYNPRNTRPVCDHLGEAPAGFWRDHESSKVNSIRTRTLIEKADMVVVRFGDQYKQWNAAFDAGYCAARNKPDSNKPARRLRSQMLVLAFRRARQPRRPSSQFPALARARCRYAFGNRRLPSWC